MLRRPCINARFGCGRTFRLDRVGDCDIVLCGRCYRRADPSLRARDKAARREGYDAGHEAGHAAGVKAALAAINPVAAAIENANAAMQAAEMKLDPLAAHVPKAPAPVKIERKYSNPMHAPRPATNGSGHSDLTPALQRVVNAIAWWRKIGREPVEKDRACVVAGYSPRASTFGVYLAELAKRGLIESTPGMVRLTPAGLALAVVPDADDRQGLHDVARGLLGPQEARVFDVVYAAYPKEIRRDDVARKVGLSPEASTAGVYISGVAAYGIIEASSRGHVRAADWLFP